MKYNLIVTKHILHELGANKSYSGFDYIVYGLSLIEQNEACLSNITKILYIDIAKKFRTSHTCVERNIRKVIEVIWKHAFEHEALIIKIFGPDYTLRKPTNREFFELLHEYIQTESAFKELLSTCDEIICPISKDSCLLCHIILDHFTHLKS